MATTWYLMMCLEQDLFKFSLSVTRYLDNTANESLFCKAAFFFLNDYLSLKWVSKAIENLSTSIFFEKIGYY